MNIKEFLMKEDEIKKLLENPTFKKYITEKNFDIRQIYLEFNTGKLFDDLSLDIQIALKEYLREILRHFEALLMSSLTKPSWPEIYKDLQLIVKKISSIGKEREIQKQKINHLNFYI